MKKPITLKKEVKIHQRGEYTKNLEKKLMKQRRKQAEEKSLYYIIMILVKNHIIILMLKIIKERPQNLHARMIIIIFQNRGV